MIALQGQYLVAVTHSSFAKEHGVIDNEILEFLGDAVLQLCVTEMLLEMFPLADEGKLTQLRHQLVNNETLASISRSLELGVVLRLGKGEEATGGRAKDTILAAGFEALLGALYEDQGLAFARYVVECQLSRKAARLFDFKPDKQILHEWSQKTYGLVPEYDLVEEVGSGQGSSFRMSVSIEGRLVAIGGGQSKKKASKDAARLAVSKLGIR